MKRLSRLVLLAGFLCGVGQRAAASGDASLEVWEMVVSAVSEANAGNYAAADKFLHSKARTKFEQIHGSTKVYWDLRTYEKTLKSDGIKVLRMHLEKDGHLSVLLQTVRQDGVVRSKKFYCTKVSGVWLIDTTLRRGES